MELITAMLREPGGNETPFWQHDTMAATYILSGIVDIFSIRDARRRVKTGKDYLIPEGFDYVVFAAAFGIQAQSLLSHLHGRTPLDVRVHQFHATLSVMSFIAVVVEALSRHHPFTPVIRGYMVMTQGTWPFNVGSGFCRCNFCQSASLPVPLWSSLCKSACLFLFNSFPICQTDWVWSILPEYWNDQNCGRNDYCPLLL